MAPLADAAKQSFVGPITIKGKTVPVGMNHIPISQTSTLVGCYGASRPQQGRTANEDAYWIGRDPFPLAVICDGAGNAQQSARRAIAFFQKLWACATLDQIRAADTWPLKCLTRSNSRDTGFEDANPDSGRLAVHQLSGGIGPHWGL